MKDINVAINIWIDTKLLFYRLAVNRLELSVQNNNVRNEFQAGFVEDCSSIVNLINTVNIYTASS